MCSKSALLAMCFNSVLGLLILSCFRILAHRVKYRFRGDRSKALNVLALRYVSSGSMVCPGSLMTTYLYLDIYIWPAEWTCGRRKVLVPDRVICKRGDPHMVCTWSYYLQSFSLSPAVVALVLRLII